MHCFPIVDFIYSVSICSYLQGVYRFNWTNFQEISRIFQEGFSKKSRTCLHCFGPISNVPNELYLMEHVMMSSNQRSSLCYSTDYNINNIFILHKQCHIINFRSLHKNLQEDHLNSRRFPGGFSNSRRFPGFPGVVDTLIYQCGIQRWLCIHRCFVWTCQSLVKFCTVQP